LPGMPTDSVARDRQPAPESVDVDTRVADHDEERPSRRLSPRLELLIGVWCFLVALFVLKQVLAPLALGSQYCLVIFLGVTLPLIFLPYRARARRSEGSDDPGILDWLLAGVALFVGLYPVLPIPLSEIGFGGFEGFLDRQGSLLTLDIAAG